MKNTGKDYEKLVQEIYQCFLNCNSEQDGFQHIEVKHNVSLQGKSGVMHQIDVYWEFELAGIIYKTIVEVKDWLSPVKKEKILAFHSLLDDIPGNPNGFFVSKGGFQTGAVQFANAHGIHLVSIHNNDLFVNIEICNVTTLYEKIYFEVNDTIFDEHPNHLKKIQDYSKDIQYSDAILISPIGEELRLAEMIYRDADPYYYEPDNQKFHIHTALPDNWFWKIGHPDYPFICVSGYGFDCYNVSEYSLLTVSLTNLADYVIEDVLKQKRNYYSQKKKKIILL